jgi:hypothetical protein
VRAKLFGNFPESSIVEPIERKLIARSSATGQGKDEMTRRGTKKALRRAEEALRRGDYVEAVAIYDAMLNGFEEEAPSLLDHAAVIWGKVKALNALGDEQGATKVAESAVYVLSVHTLLEAAAA